jgi:hypothetical protein
MKPAIALFLAFAAPAIAEEYPEFEVGWLMFGDLYHVPSHHLDEGEGATAAVIRRGYLTFDAQFNEAWEGRLRFELNQSGEFETYDFEVDVKDLYVARQLGQQELMIGLSPTVTYALIEGIWGLRYLMRTPMDLQGVASRDTGVKLGGPLNSSGSLNYSVMIGTGIEFGAEAGDGRKTMASLSWQPAEGYFLEWYVDYEKLVGRTDRSTLQFFAGHSSDALRWGLQYSYQDRQDDPTLALASGFIVRPVSPKWNAIGRIDRIMEPSPEGDNISYIPFDPSAPATMFLAGFEYRAAEHFMIVPNGIVTTYDRDDEGIRPNTDVQLRLTFFLDFE